jgi:glycosyltransferase involved in cell wall biosynthesis
MTKRQKVVHVITRLDFGGAQQNTLWTVKNIDSRKYEAVLVCGKGGFLDEEARRDCESGRFRAVFFSSLRREINPFSDLLALCGLTWFFLREKPDIVHTHSSKAGILGRLAAWLSGVKIVIHTYHGFGFNDRQNPLVKNMYAFLERLCARKSGAFVFVSRANWDYAIKHGIGPESRFHLIRSGVDLSRLPAEVKDRRLKKEELGFNADYPLVISIGNLKPQKNPGDFVDLAAKVILSIPQAEFLFIGDGPLRAEVERRAASLGLSKKIRFPGWRKDAAQWLAVADAFVLTSLWEGLPRSLVEAMKSGLPCAAYAVDGICDLIQEGENGFLVPIKNIDALSERVIGLLSDPDLSRRMGLKAQKFISQDFDIGLMVKSQENLYAELLAGQRA